MLHLRCASLMLSVFVAMAGEAVAADNIGVAATVVNTVTGTQAAETRTLKSADPVFLDDKMKTGDQSKAQFLFLDETALSLGPKSEAVLDKFVFDPNVTGKKVVLNASVGVFRFVTGNLGSQNYEINTPTATIGVRGTIVSFSVTDTETCVLLDEGGVDVLGSNSRSAALSVPGQAVCMDNGNRPPEVREAWPELVNALRPVREDAVTPDVTPPDAPPPLGGQPVDPKDLNETQRNIVDPPPPPPISCPNGEIVNGECVFGY
jgi:hypothetical protein